MSAPASASSSSNSSAPAAAMALARSAPINTAGTTPTTFHSFEKLPYEIRTMIWSLATPSPRKIKQKTRLVRTSRRKKIRKEGKSSLQTYYTFSIPPLLHTCRESRAEWLLGPEETKIPASIKHPMYRIINGVSKFHDAKRKVIFCKDLDKVLLSFFGRENLLPAEELGMGAPRIE